MSNPAVIGLDMAKNVFQAHGVDAEGRCVLRPAGSPSRTVLKCEPAELLRVSAAE